MGSQLDRYGERTARGIAGGNNVCWVLAIGQKKRVRNSAMNNSKWNMIEDIARLEYRNGP
jgi:hypothetical protein